jgi:signal transduction histidine kinase
MNKTKKAKPLIVILSLIITLNIAFMMTIHIIHDYNHTKAELSENLDKFADFTLMYLDPIVSYNIESFSVDDVEKIIQNIVEKKSDVISIVVKDYKMAEVFGQDTFVFGKIRTSLNNIIDYDNKDLVHKSILKNTSMVKKVDLFNKSKTKIGEIELYLTDDYINQEVKLFLKKTILEMLVLTVVVSLVLFFAIEKFILSPLYNIISHIENKNADGIPLNTIPNSGPKEIVELSNTLNNMINKIKVSKKNLRDLNLQLEQKVETKINELRDKEQILVQQSKLASMGEMIGNIAHQWRQPLTAAKATIQAIEFKSRLGKLDNEFLSKKSKEASELIDYMSNTIDDFRNFFLPSKQKVEFSLVNSFNSINTIVASQLKNNNIKLVLDDKIKDIKVNGYPNEFQQVVINMINNSKDAIKSRIEKKEIDNGLIEVKISNENQDYFDIEIIDNGGGIPKDIINKIFEPYFTTKFESNGTGLGLYMSKAIIETNMGGKLFVENIGSGTKFTIRLKKENKLS